MNNTTILNGFGHPWETYVWPAVPVLKFKTGQKVVLNGRVYRNSLMGGPGAIFTNRVGFIRFLINDEVVPAPYHIDGLGWAKEESLTLAPITIEICKIKVGDKVKISGTHIMLPVRKSRSGANYASIQWRLSLDPEQDSKR